MQEVQVERKYQSAASAIAGFKKLAPVKEFADIYVTKDLNDLQSMGVAPFTVQEIVESVNSEQTGCETEHEVKVYKLIDTTEEVWIRAEVHLNHSEIEEV